MFKTHITNLEDAKLAIEQYGECWLHGCGNIYTDKGAHEFRAKYGNPLHNGNPSAGAYFVHFTSVSQVPTSLERLHGMFHANRTKQVEEAAAKDNKVAAPVQVLKARATPPKAQGEAGTTEDLSGASAHLAQKAAHLQSREVLLDETEVNLELKSQELANKELSILQAQKDAAAATEALKAKEAQLAAMEAELKKQAAILAKKTPAANS